MITRFNLNLGLVKNSFSFQSKNSAISHILHLKKTPFLVEFSESILLKICLLKAGTCLLQVY